MSNGSRVVTRLEGMPALGIKAPVKAIAQANLALLGLVVVDQYQTLDGDRILAISQTLGTDNGIWVARQKAWERAPDWNQDDDVVSGVLILDTIRRAGWMAEFTGPFRIKTTEPNFVPIYGDIAVSPAGEANFNPGYALTFVSTTSFSIDGINVTNLYHVGRRIRFKDNLANESAGVVLTSVFTTDTVITMTMEGADVVPGIMTAAILTTSDVQWSPLPVPNHPFVSMAKAKIVSGRIGEEDWWVIVGSGGFIATSNDGGNFWKQRTITGGLAAQDINDVAYDPDNQRFMAVADGTWIITSVDGVAWVSSQESTLLAAIASGNGDLDHIAYGNTSLSSNLGFAVVGAFSSATNNDVYWSTDYGATFALGIANSVSIANGKFYRWNDSVTKKYFFTNTFSQTPQVATWTSTNEDSSGAGGQDIDFDPGVSPNNIAITVHADGQIRMGGGGGVSAWSNLQVINTGTFGTTDLLCIVFSVLLGRWVACGKDGKIGFAERTGAPNPWTLVTNGFNPTAHILDIAFDENNGLFIAISNDGNICRSTTGIS